MRMPPYYFILPETTFISEEQAKILNKAFCEPFRGDSVEWLEKGLKAYEELWKATPNRYFGKTIPIVQSSGMGKTRAVAELSKKVRHPIQLSLRRLIRTLYIPALRSQRLLSRYQENHI